MCEGGGVGGDRTGRGGGGGRVNTTTIVYSCHVHARVPGTCSYP